MIVPVTLRLLQFFVSICSVVPILLFWWCRQMILTVSGSIRGSLNYCDFVGSSYLVTYVGI